MNLELTFEEAQLICGALNVSSVLRNTIAPITVSQLEQGKQERQLGWRVLNALAITDRVDTAAPQLEQLLEAVRAFVLQQDQLAAGDFAGDLFETMKHALAAIGVPR